MLIPRKVKHRKQHHPEQRGIASGGTSVSFGEYGIQALGHAYITNKELAREQAGAKSTRPERSDRPRRAPRAQAEAPVAEGASR